MLNMGRRKQHNPKKTADADENSGKQHKRFATKINTLFNLAQFKKPCKHRCWRRLGGEDRKHNSQEGWSQGWRWPHHQHWVGSTLDAANPDSTPNVNASCSLEARGSQRQWNRRPCHVQFLAVQPFGWATTFAHPTPFLSRSLGATAENFRRAHT